MCGAPSIVPEVGWGYKRTPRFHFAITCEGLLHVKCQHQAERQSPEVSLWFLGSCINLIEWEWLNRSLSIPAISARIAWIM